MPSPPYHKLRDESGRAAFGTLEARQDDKFALQNFLKRGSAIGCQTIVPDRYDALLQRPGRLP